MMEPASGDPDTSLIPVDLTITKCLPGLTRGCLKVTDSQGNLVFLVDDISSSKKRTLIDAMKKPIISIYRCNDNTETAVTSECSNVKTKPKQGDGWKGYIGESCDLKDSIFRVVRTLHSWLRTELQVFLVGANWEESTSDFRVQGSPFHRSCIIYKGNSIIAQTSAMYKLGKVLVGRSKFRLTIYPGTDHALVVALLVIFFGGK